jgi:D-alanine-D-alanine ligase
MHSGSGTGRDGRPRVVLLYGGRSSEHEVSCLTAASVLTAIDPRRYDVIPVGITRDGRWVLPDAPPAEGAAPSGSLPTVGDGVDVVLIPDPARPALAACRPGSPPADLGPVDVVFPVLHGPGGEDGTVQGLLELSGVPYVGSGVFASAAGMDKGHMRELFRAAGLPLGPSVLVTAARWEADPAGVHADVAALGYPVFVKPARAGSSIGISKVHEPSQLPAALAQARAHDPRIVVEAAISGREVECGVLERPDRTGPAVSVVGELVVRADHEFYDYEAKYLDGSTSLCIPADLPAPTVQQVQTLALAAFEALSCEGLARVDFFVTPDGGVLVNELNTMPGFTPTSMFPRLWAACGLDYPSLVDQLLRTALARPSGLR